MLGPSISHPVILKRSSWLGIAAIFAIYGGVAVLQVGLSKEWYNFFEYFISVRGLCYFIVGLGLRYNGMLTYDRSARIVCLLGIAMLMAKITLLRYSFLKVAAAIDVAMVPALMYGSFYALRNINLPIQLIHNAFAIYLIHQVLLLFSIVVISVSGLRGFMDVSIVIWVVRFVLAVFMSIAIACCARKFFPHQARLFFGGR